MRLKDKCWLTNCTLRALWFVSNTKIKLWFHLSTTTTKNVFHLIKVMPMLSGSADEFHKCYKQKYFLYFFYHFKNKIKTAGDHF